MTISNIIVASHFYRQIAYRVLQKWSSKRSDVFVIVTSNQITIINDQISDRNYSFCILSKTRKMRHLIQENPNFFFFTRRHLSIFGYTPPRIVSTCLIIFAVIFWIFITPLGQRSPSFPIFFLRLRLCCFLCAFCVLHSRDMPTCSSWWLRYLINFIDFLSFVRIFIPCSVRLRFYGLSLP